MTKKEIVRKAVEVIESWAAAEVGSNVGPLRIELEILPAGILNPHYALDVKRTRLSHYQHEQFS